MALTKITSRILDSSGVTILGTIATGVWQGTAINQTYLVGQSGTNTGDETLARINALDVTELGTVSSGVWNGTAIASAYLDADTAHLSTTQNFTGTKTFSGVVGIGSTGIYAGSAAILNLQGIGIALKNDKDGSDNNWSYIQNTGTGSASDINFYTGNNESALNLSHSGAATFSGDVNFTGASYNAVWDTSANLLQFADNAVIRIGTGNDVDIYHSSNVTYIKTQTDQPVSFIDAGGADMLKLTPNGAVNLYHNGTLALSTGSGGAATFGGNVLFNLDGDSTLSINDGGTNASQIKAGAGDELYIGANNTYALRFLNNGTNDVVFDAGSNVGIGTASPNQKLTIGFANNGTDGISFRSTTYASLGKILCQNDNASTNGNLQFLTRLGGDVIERMRITSGGNVGIGDPPPTSPNGADKYLSIGGNIQDASIILKDATETWEIYQNNDLSFSYGTTPTTVLKLQRSTGNVGIGTASPLQLLDVQSSTASPKIMVKVNGQAGTTNPTAELILGAGPISSNDSACKIISFRTANYSSAAARSSGLKFQVTQNNGPRLALTIAETGVVSIPNGIVLDSNTTGGTPNATNVTLNAYEEGTWTPTLSVSGVSYTKQEGKYTRIGNVVHYWIDINFTATSGYIIYNLYLPFTTSFSSFYGSAAIGNAYRINLGTGGTMLGGYYSVNYIRLHSSGNSTGQLSPIATGGNMTIRMEGIYQAL